MRTLFAQISQTSYDGLQTTGPTLNAPSSEQVAMLGMVSMIFLAVMLVFVVLLIVGMWKLFEKAGRPAWATLVPIYNNWVLFEIAGRPGWWAIASFIPVVGFILAVILALDLAAKFGKSTGFGVFAFFFPQFAYMVLGFGKAQYNGGGNISTSANRPDATVQTPPATGGGPAPNTPTTTQHY